MNARQLFANSASQTMSNRCLSRDRGEWRSAGDTARLAPSWLYTFGLHLRLAQVRLPLQPGTQVLVAFLWVYTMILTIAYSTNLTAFLLVKKLPASIETLEQLSQSTVKVAGVGELFMTELQEASDPNVKVSPLLHMQCTHTLF